MRAFFGAPFALLDFGARHLPADAVQSPPLPDVTVVVIINKRSGSRLVRTASRPVRVKRRENAPSLPHLFPRRILAFRAAPRRAILTAPRLILKSNRRACNSRAN